MTRAELGEPKNDTTISVLTMSGILTSAPASSTYSTTGIWPLREATIKTCSPF